MTQLNADGIWNQIRQNINIKQAVEKVVRVVRQAHHERLKTNEFNAPSVRPELVEG
jgi:hypothetical protein